MARRVSGRAASAREFGGDRPFSLAATLDHYEVEELTLTQASRLLEKTRRHRSMMLEATEFESA
jgi:hypothetical protein